MWIKQRNRACETLLEKWAEPFSTWAQVFAHPSDGLRLRHPETVLRQAWRLLMQCHPHDSICGCSIDQVHDEMRPRFDQVEQMAEEITHQSLEALAGAVTTRPPAQPAGGVASSPVASAVVVFNPTTGPRSGAVNVDIDAPTESGAFELLDEHGTPMPFQTLGMGSGELFNTVMDRTEFQNVFNMVSAGTDVAGIKILGMHWRREGNEVSIEVRAGQTGEPDLAEWERSRQEVEALLKDPAITTFHVRVQSVASSQVLFVARDVPAYGYRTFWVRAKEGVHKEPVRLSPVARALMPLGARLAANPGVQNLIRRLTPDPASKPKPPYRIENEYFAVEAQPNGSLDVLDKRTRVLYRGQNRFVDGGDRGDEYNYSPPEADRMAPVRLNGVRITRGDVQQTLELALEMETPAELETDRKSRSRKTVRLPLSSRVTLTAGVERVDIHTEIDNQARDHRLRVHFAAPFAVDEAAYDGHFEVVRRPVGVPAFDASWAEQPRPEVPQRAFCAVSDGTNGLLVANRGLPEVEVLRRGDGNTEIALTLLRCVGWLSRDDIPERKGPAGPKLPTPGAQMAGHWAFDYAIIPFPEANRLQAYHQAYAFEAPLRALSTTPHEGTLPAQGSFIQVEPKEFIVSAVKTAEDGRGWLVRGYNISNQPAAVKLKTLHPPPTVERVNLAEERLGNITPPTDLEISLDAGAHEVVSVLFGGR
jgi:alpha-mannosidase